MGATGRMVGLALLLAALPASADDRSSGAPGALAPLEQLTRRILLIEQQAADAAREVKELEHQIAEAGRRLRALQGREAERSSLLRGRLRQMYKTSRGGFFRLAFNARDGEDLFALLSSASRVLERDVKELKLYRGERRRQQDQRRRLEASRQRKERLSAGLLHTLKRLSTARARLGRLLALVGDSPDRRQRLLAVLNDQDRRLLERVEGMSHQQGGDGGFAARKGQLPRPVAGPLAVRFGQQEDRETGLALRHRGFTFRPIRGAAVKAVAGGIVRQAGPFAGYGELVILEHAGGYYSIYGYLAGASVKEGEQVTAGQKLGVAGLHPMTGKRAVYFELRHGRHALDPGKWLR